MRHYVPLVLVLCLGLGPACSSNDQPQPVLNFSDYHAAFNQAIADYLIRCGVLDSSRTAQLQKTSILAVAPELQSTIDMEVAAGRVQLTTDCFAPLKTAPCDLQTANAAISDCITGGKQYLPQVNVGRLCRLQGECIGGFCDLGAIKRPCGMGVCSAYLPVGTKCDPTKIQCDPDKASCWTDQSGSSACRARSGPGGDCASDADCAASSTCSLAKCAARQMNLAVGSACNPGQDPTGCQAGSRCLQPSGQTSSVCTALHPAGSSCFSTSECADVMVCVGAAAATNTPGTCQKQGKLGSSCSAAGSICQITLYCSPQDGTCNSSADVNQQCEGVLVGQTCLSGRCSVTTGTGTCQAPATDGSACNTSSDCQSGVCARNLCTSVCAPL